MCVIGFNCCSSLLFPQQWGESSHTFTNWFLVIKFCPSLNFVHLKKKKVQSELRRKWRSLSLKRYVGQDYKPQAASLNQNVTENSEQFPRNFRAQSILQTETTVLWPEVHAEGRFYRHIIQYNRKWTCELLKDLLWFSVFTSHCACWSHTETCISWNEHSFMKHIFMFDHHMCRYMTSYWHYKQVCSHSNTVGGSVHL